MDNKNAKAGMNAQKAKTTPGAGGADGMAAKKANANAAGQKAQSGKPASQMKGSEA